MTAILSPDEISGAWAMMPTPSLDGAESWRMENTVDLAETERVVEGLIESGINGILSMGTLGECATLTWEERKAFISTLVETVDHRVPVFVGSTTLNTRDTIKELRFARDVGATGSMLGIPMWCAPSVDIAIQFYRDVAEAVPEMNLAIYANPEAFKFDFPAAFWAQVAEIPQVVTAKYIGIGTLMRDLAAIQGKIKLLPGDFDYYASARMIDSIDGFWSSGAVCGPNVSLRLRDLVEQARRTGDWEPALAFNKRLSRSFAPLFPNGSFKTFSTYNVGLEKARMDAAGWMRAGPVRPPYHIIPEEYLAGARKSGELWAEIGDSVWRENV